LCDSASVQKGDEEQEGVKRGATLRMLSIFPVFSILYLGDRFKWNYGVGFAFIVAAAFFIFHKW
jgi:uncharacterized protein (DUF486 family)